MKFLSELASSSVSPGGGSAAAFAGALGASLVEMVARINARKHAGRDLSKIQKLRKRLERLVKLDAETFRSQMRFFKEARTSPRFQRALKRSAAVPLEICRLCAQALEWGVLEKTRTSRWLFSDLAEAAILLQAAFQSARLNVSANLRGMADKNFARKTERYLDVLEKRITRWRLEIGKPPKP